MRRSPAAAAAHNDPLPRPVDIRRL